MKLSSETKSPGVTAILIDDDSLVRMSWEHAARSSGKRLLSFASVADFEASDESVTGETPLFIDSNLGKDQRGEIISKDLFARGHLRIYLVTGYPPDSFGRLPWLTEVLDKVPPPWLFARGGRA